MHEMSLMRDLMAKVLRVSADHGNVRVKGVHLQVGALAHISPQHLREHFVAAARGTVAEGAEVIAEMMADVHDIQAQDIVLGSLELEVADAPGF